jgi:hypothetical protein
MAHGPQDDFAALLDRMRRRWYPETTPVLASYWLRAVYAAGHERAWWKELDKLITRALWQPLPNPAAREALNDIQAWMRDADIAAARHPEPPPRIQGVREKLLPERLAPYVQRLLNEWLPAEIARSLVENGEDGGGIPVLAAATALERLLVRERLSRETLDLLLRPEILSPEYFYPEHAEILIDVAAALLGRASVPPPAVMPAVLLAVAAASPLPSDYAEAVRRATLLPGDSCDRVQVPLSAAQAMEILKHDPVRIASVIVTTDGRWWESDNLQSGEREAAIIYKPRGRLRIDTSADHIRLVVPWPDTPLRWPGEVHFQEPIVLFGREWHESRWEFDGERSWLHLVFSRAVPAADPKPEDAPLGRARPAAVDIAWSALEIALAEALAQESAERIEQLRRTEFVPLGRAVLRLAQLARSGGMRNVDNMATQLRAIRYLEAGISLTYGKVPWRVLPAAVQSILLGKHTDPALLDLLHEVFEALPEPAGRTSPPHAA